MRPSTRGGYPHGPGDPLRSLPLRGRRCPHSPAPVVFIETSHWSSMLAEYVPVLVFIVVAL
ncbi:MAG: hypothetical protein ACREXX_17780, partial [Gammaproteobacteria bacterium]